MLGIEYVIYWFSQYGAGYAIIYYFTNHFFIIDTIKQLFYRMVGDILKTRLMVKKSMKEYKEDKVGALC